jgi:hypothetical protein
VFASIGGMLAETAGAVADGAYDKPGTPPLGRFCFAR